jgi:DDE family transposase
MKSLQGLLPFRIELSPEPLGVTAFSGLPLIIEAMRALIAKRFYRDLRDTLAYKSWRAVRRHIESLVALIVAGGDCIDDLGMLRGDPGLRSLLGFAPSSPTQAKDFLYRFHQAEDGRALTAQDDASLSVAGKASIRAEGPGLRALGALVGEVVRRLQAEHPRHRATLDIDATIVEAHKATALTAYEGTVGYQPQMAWWAEQSVWVTDEFRDGNVPAAFGVKAFLERAFSGLPGSVSERRLRGDSALYDEKALTWADDQGIEFAVSADMSKELVTKSRAVPDDVWQPYRSLDGDRSDEMGRQEERQWAEIADFVPGWNRNHRKHGTPFRYVAIRVRSRQRDLLSSDAERWRHFAVVTNMGWNGENLLRWHREKQGTVEQGHGVLKGELAGDRLPCAKFGASATWWRLNVLAHNLLMFLKVKALPRELASLHPKALRLRLFNLAGRLLRRSRRLVLKIWEHNPAAKIIVDARRVLLLMPAPS